MQKRAPGYAGGPIRIIINPKERPIIISAGPKVIEAGTHSYFPFIVRSPTINLELKRFVDGFEKTPRHTIPYNRQSRAGCTDVARARVSSGRTLCFWDLRSRDAPRCERQPTGRLSSRTKSQPHGSPEDVRVKRRLRRFRRGHQSLVCLDRRSRDLLVAHPSALVVTSSH